MDWGSCVDKTNAVGAGVAKLSCIPVVISNLISWGLNLGVIFALAFMIYAGFKMITSGGDPKKIDDARKTLVYAILGLVIIFISFFIVNVIAYLTGAECIKALGLNVCGVVSGGRNPLDCPPGAGGCR